MKITTGNNGYEVIATGSVISFKDESINFEFSENLKFFIRFVTDTDAPENQIMFEGDGLKMDVILTNFDNAHHVGNVDPVGVGFINGKNLYMAISCVGHGTGNGKLLHYTFYSRENKVNP